MKKIFYIMMVASTLFISCDEGGEPNQQNTMSKDFAGDWHVRGFLPDGTLESDYTKFSTYNASSNDGNFWIEEDKAHQHFELKTKVLGDGGSLTFAGKPNADEVVSGGKVTISNGKILKDAAKSFSGHVVDSIYFEAEFDWDPGVIYKLGGHKRTGFLEDEL